MTEKIKKSFSSFLYHLICRNQKNGKRKDVQLRSCLMWMLSEPLEVKLQQMEISKCLRITDTTGGVSYSKVLLCQP